MALLLVTSIVLEISEPQIIAVFIRSVQEGTAQSVLMVTALVFLAVALTRQCTRVFAAYASERVAWTATNKVREDLATHVLGLDLAFHAVHPPGELVERIDGDVNQVAEFFSAMIVQLIGNALLILGILGALTLADWRIGVTFTAITLLGYVLLAKVSVIASGKWEADRDQSGRFFGYVGETIRATEDLKSAHAIEYAMTGFHRHLRAWLPVKFRAETWASLIWVVLTLVFTAGTAVVFGFSGWFAQNGTISLANVYLVVAYATTITVPLEVLREKMQGLQQARASLRRIARLFAVRPTIGEGTRSLPEGPLSVEFDHVRFEYKHDDVPQLTEIQAEPPSRKEVLGDLSFQVPAGTSMGLVGRTGAGKTTIAQLLFRLYEPSGGRVLVDGVDVREARSSSVRTRVGLVTQDVHVFDATLRDNLTFFDDSVPDDKLVEILDTLGIRPWFAGLTAGLDTPLSPRSMSAGEAQVLALARVFVKDPGLVILDEPSSKLDLFTESMLQRAFDVLLAGRTVIVIAHRLDTIRRTDTTIVLDDGAVVESGSTAELLDDPGSRLAELFRIGEVSRR
ncbi:ABC transporter ATP-binding protein [Actinocrispum wychmicini]|uniref:ATP-binding cassette subfamily B protein/ATP-binding cassette subfamily C protein n=1 Tax=Actinocrispum wychmicini TaxID=1213861 RepID=A0A4R2JQR8_9PSEU|nr:ABC transporter ATP-binding protein [Actinocrispum wychmicini]TCO59546.1 ATP-binding cassette subfamily B protein/ATP-binding cassette subfamily C protein [Actinocrispum wychmicini]